MRQLFLNRLDWVVVSCSFLLTALGLLVLYSSGIKAASVQSEIDTTRQLFYAGVGLICLIGFSRLDYRSLKSYVLPLSIVTMAALLAVELVGKAALGAQRWITIGFFQFQPSEFSKLAFIIVLAAFYARIYERSHQLRYLVFSILILLPPLVLVVGQPDLGTGLVFIAIWLAMTLGSLVQKRYLLFGGLGMAALLPIVYQFLATYQKNRIVVLFNPQADRLGTGYNVTQSIIAVGSGGWFGRGLSSGSQSQLNFLPSQHTDFIFAVLAEKLGFLGGLVTIGLFAILIARIFIVSTQSIDRFGSFLCIGIGSMLAFHVLINIGMNMGIMPVTGIPLPFISAGGTSMIVTMSLIGIVLSVAAHRDTKRQLKVEGI